MLSDKEMRERVTRFLDSHGEKFTNAALADMIVCMFRHDPEVIGFDEWEKQTKATEKSILNRLRNRKS